VRLREVLTVRGPRRCSPPTSASGPVTLLGGRHSGSKLLDLPGKVDFKDSYTAGLSVAYQFVDWGPHMRWELEGQALKHFGEQERVELVSSINVRWITFPWNKYLDTSLAFGGIFGLFSHRGSNLLELGLRYRF